MSTKPFVVLGTLILNRKLVSMDKYSLWEAFILPHEESKGMVAI